MSNLVPSDASAEDSKSQSESILNKNQRKNQRRRETSKAAKASGQSNASDATEDTKTLTGVEQTTGVSTLPMGRQPIETASPNQLLKTSTPAHRDAAKQKVVEVATAQEAATALPAQMALHSLPQASINELRNAAAQINMRQGQEQKRLDKELKQLKAVFEAEIQMLKVKAEADRAKAEADRAKAEADRAKAEADRAKVEADRAKAEADRAKAEADRAKAEADRAKAEADRAESWAEIKTLNAEAEADSAEIRAEIKMLKAKVEVNSAGIKTLESRVATLESDMKNIEARLRAHTRDIDSAFAMSKDVLQYVATHDSFWKNRIRRRAIVVHAQEVLAQALLSDSSSDDKKPPPGSLWKKILDSKVSETDTKGRVELVKELLSTFANTTDTAAVTKTLIDNLTANDLAMKWISDDFGELRNLGNESDAPHPQYNKMAWQEVLDDMNTEKQISDDEKISLRLLVEAMTHIENEYPAQSR
ncbi:hypothetical protein JR316_0012444 [Psilocybe cubensis]|uniref:Uncharacterized protein n=1 Tax=Psilocybe cubensis TaxID=181762 RepID=A0ACB8GIF2_PSICU|nr:hypothetical protein JR316_0012444 [Psilocybe cubensis]KAH9475333.1 hypothetical protein JR316_0012444 [Psilocybe cubensis]